MTETEFTLRLNRIQEEAQRLKEDQATHPCDEAFFHYYQSQIDRIESELDVLTREQKGAIF